MCSGYLLRFEPEDKPEEPRTQPEIPAAEPLDTAGAAIYGNISKLLLQRLVRSRAVYR